MRAAAMALLLGGLAQCEDSAAGGVAATAPSGLSHDLQEMVLEPQGAPMGSVRVVRLRYVAVEIADESAMGFEKIEGDFKWLCQTDGIARRDKSAPNAEQIVISIASEPVAFGEIAPSVVQYFDAFRIENGDCIWDG